MKQLSTLSLTILLSCNMNNTNSVDVLKQDLNEINTIKKILSSQQECWNNGDIDGFMQGYWNSEKLVFTSLNHKPAYGWKNTLERYKNSYPTKTSMGELRFEILNLKLISKTTATLKGKWELIRQKDHPNGLFWLDIEKFDNNWLITKDSTVSFEINNPI
ncbi:hypothetical protein N8692_02600 [Flavobacteriales bacterium]|nr:hypothetical protein [Flavobacteriales bacterium]